MTDNSRHSDATDRSPGVTIGDVIGGIRGSIIAGRDVILSTSAEQRAQRNRRAMLELVKNTWIKGVLEQSLHGAAMIELGMEERAEAVEHPWDMVLRMPDRPNRELPAGTKIIDVFDEMNRSLLILGEPGSGKTTMLLELARDTIARAEEDPTQLIPVIFNLSSWAEKRQPIAEWLMEELNTKYYIPKRIGRPWVENDDLLLLLDGLDEVAAQHRDACVEATNHFRQEHALMPIVICSRVAEYEALTTWLKLQSAVILQPLTPKQIDEYLAGAGTELLAVRRSLQHDPELRELVQSPLMLSVMALAYRGMSIEDLGSLSAIEARRRHLFDKYVQRMFERRGTDPRYPPGRVFRWLKYLAQEMSQHAQTTFLIERIQPTWLQTGAQLRSYVVSVRSIYAVILGLFGGLIGGLNGQLILGFFGGLLVWLWVGLASEPVGWVIPTEVLRLSWKGLREGLIYGFVVGSCYGLIVALVTGVFFGPKVGRIYGLRVGLQAGLVYGLKVGFYYGLKSALIAVPVLALGSGLSIAMIKTRTIPNQGIRHSLENAVVTALIVGLVSEFVLKKLAGLSGGLMFGLFFGLYFGGGAVIRHAALRFILYGNGYIPWNLTRFLDYATERIFLRKVGGGYIFVHRLLQDYFASMHEEVS